MKNEKIYIDISKNLMVDRSELWKKFSEGLEAQQFVEEVFKMCSSIMHNEIKKNSTEYNAEVEAVVESAFGTFVINGAYKELK